MPDTDRPVPRIRLKDIADRCGVSTSTVSRALSGRPGVRADLRARMIDAARQAGYPVADALAGQRVLVAASGAAMTDYGRNQFTWHVLDGMRTRARSLDLHLMPFSLEGVGLAGLRAGVADRQPAGLLLLTVDERDVLDHCAAAGLPAVIVNGDDPWMRISSVAPCNRSAARLATDHLLDHGHRDLLFVLRPGRTTIQRRLEGWRDALSARGLPAGDDRVVTVRDWVPDQAEAAVHRRLASCRRDFTAVLCAADTLAAGVIKALAAHGLAVPDQVSVMGMDDLPVVEFWQPPLTTIHVPGREMGHVALEMLGDHLSGAATLPRRVELACRLVERGSVASARGAD